MSNPSDIYKRAKEKWGVEVQLGIALEELGELVTALCRYMFREKGGLSDVVDELADCQIMIEQVATMLRIEDAVEQRYHHKLRRLEKVLEGE